MAKRSIFAPWLKDTTPPARTPAPTDDEADVAYLAERARAAAERITESMRGEAPPPARPGRGPEI